MWIVKDGRICSHRFHVAVLDATEYILALLGVLGRWAYQENSDRGRLWRFGDVNQLIETGHTECDVLGGHTSVVKRVQRHLRCGLTQRLCGKGADHFAWMGNGSIEFGLDLANDPLEGLTGQVVLLDHALRTQRAAQVDIEQHSGVVLRLYRQAIFTRHNDQSTAELA